MIRPPTVFAPQILSKAPVHQTKSLMDFFNPEGRILIRVKDCALWGNMHRDHAFLETGTIVKISDRAYGDRICLWQEENTLRDRARRAGHHDIASAGYYRSSDTGWDVLQSGDRIDWWGTSYVVERGSHLLLLGHVVFPWYAFKSGMGRRLENRPMTLCTQIWQPIDAEKGMSYGPFAQTLRKDERDIVIPGQSGFHSTDDFGAKEDGVMEGLSFEVVDRTFLSYQPEWVKIDVQELEDWSEG